ncbi:MAG: formylglycine-generating enzyme family protein, partial [Planctomycetes bacterium]|nr:formylglycine-generating enzyme family protein [Planctomycetota bacterium]
GRRYRLPTEAEWEYACRAGTATPFSFGSSAPSTLANFNGNSPYGGAPKGPYLERPTTVGSYAPNAFGLFDMHGNVWEWCSDYFDANYYQQPVGVDPQGPTVGNEKDLRVLRGGCCADGPGNARSATRGKTTPDSRYGTVGFRVVCAVGVSTL